MTWAQAIIVYFVCWWLLFFMALPFGIHPGENGAPEKPHLAIKGAAVTFLAGLATWGIDLLLRSGIVAVK